MLTPLQNVLLDPSEANLPQQIVVLTSQIVTIDKDLFGEYIGTLSAARVALILDGLHRLTKPRAAVDKPEP